MTRSRSGFRDCEKSLRSHGGTRIFTDEAFRVSIVSVRGSIYFLHSLLYRFLIENEATQGVGARVLEANGL